MNYTCNNINQALWYLGDQAHLNLERGMFCEETRNGPVTRLGLGPAVIHHKFPYNRVLLNPLRDANPFFHLMEALWMLGGRNDVEWLSMYTSQMKQYSDDGVVLNGAYGNRWRNAEVKRTRAEFFGKYKVDQIDLLVNHLRANPNSRRAVLAMWNVEDDLLGIGDLQGFKFSKDVCCNLSVVFELTTRENREYLNMTVYNRSNDLVYGALGANMVHFSYLMEYVAARCGALIGSYYQVSSNLHCYEKGFDYEFLANGWLDGPPEGENPDAGKLVSHILKPYGMEVRKHGVKEDDPTRVYVKDKYPEVLPVRLAAVGRMAESHSNPESCSLEMPQFLPGEADPRQPKILEGPNDNRLFMQELERFFEDTANRSVPGVGPKPQIIADVYDSPWLEHVAKPMHNAFACHTWRDYSGACHWLYKQNDPNWQLAACWWLRMRAHHWHTVVEPRETQKRREALLGD